MTDIAETLEELTPAWFTGALQEGGTIAPATTVTDAACRHIGTGQLGSVALAELSYDGGNGPPTLIVKQPSTNEGSRGVGLAMGVYRSEVRYYEQIAPLVGLSAPKLHWSALDETTGRFTLVLDDLRSTTTVGDMIAGATENQIELACDELVQLQAPLWDSPEITERDWLADQTGTRGLFAAVPTAVAPFEARFGERLEPRQLELVTRLAPSAPNVVDLVWKPPFVVAHGDYRLDNMLFANDGSGVSVIDWQACRLAPPCLDLAIFLATCVDIETRRARERDILQRHVDRLAEHGVQDFGIDDAWESYRAASLYPFLLCVFTAITLEQTERGDEMWTRLIQGAADLVADTEADRILT